MCRAAVMRVQRRKNKKAKQKKKRREEERKERGQQIQLTGLGGAEKTDAKSSIDSFDRLL